MSDSPACESAQLELSVAHDESRPPSEEITAHVSVCPECTAFQRRLAPLDEALARGDVSRAPDLSGQLRQGRAATRPGWWAVAAVALVGVAAGVVMAGVGRLDTVQAHDLDNRFHAASPAVTGLTAQVVVVERDWHPDVPERVYGGSLAYSSPESLALVLNDTTSYPNDDWTPNHVTLEAVDGDLVVVASSPCPRQALPHCQQPAGVTAFQDLRPFDPGVVAPLEIVGPAATFSWWSGLAVIGPADLDGVPTIQVETTVSGVELLAAITEHGAWRELHPTDRALLWLDETTLVPLRVEVFGADSPERDLWALRRGYSDPASEAILVVALTDVSVDAPAIDVVVPADARSGGFVDQPTEVPTPELEAGFDMHRRGRWELPGGGTVGVSSWSDGRSWIMVEATADWDEPSLFGLSTAFARPITLADGSAGYLDPTGSRLSIHTGDLDVVVSGSVTTEALLAAGASLRLGGEQIPGNWLQARTVEPAELPSGTLVPAADGWSILGLTEGDRTEILLAGTGAQRVVISAEPGNRLSQPVGADVVSVEVRGHDGRFDASSATLAWVEGGTVLQMRSDTVGLGELVRLATDMAPVP